MLNSLPIRRPITINDEESDRLFLQDHSGNEREGEEIVLPNENEKYNKYTTYDVESLFDADLYNIKKQLGPFVDRFEYKALLKIAENKIQPILSKDKKNIKIISVAK